MPTKQFLVTRLLILTISMTLFACTANTATENVHITPERASDFYDTETPQATEMIEVDEDEECGLVELGPMEILTFDIADVGGAALPDATVAINSRALGPPDCTQESCSYIDFGQPDETRMEVEITHDGYAGYTTTITIPSTEPHCGTSYPIRSEVVVARLAPLCTAEARFALIDLALSSPVDPSLSLAFLSIGGNGDETISGQCTPLEGRHSCTVPVADVDEPLSIDGTLNVCGHRPVQLTIPTTQDPESGCYYADPVGPITLQPVDDYRSGIPVELVDENGQPFDKSIRNFYANVFNYDRNIAHTPYRLVSQCSAPSAVCTRYELQVTEPGSYDIVFSGTGFWGSTTVDVSADFLGCPVLEQEPVTVTFKSQ